MSQNMVVGYTAGAFDLFHIGHLNLLRAARQRCDKLMVAVNTDRLIQTYKQKDAWIPFTERIEIVRALRCVDEVVGRDDLDKVAAWREYGFHVVFIGDDWKGTERWRRDEELLAAEGVRVEYLPYTKGVSSTILRERMQSSCEDNSASP